jgi:ribosome-associated heat shock protein Hsp15
MSVRLDKWLHVARLFKTRTVAAQACDQGRVQVNGLVAKSHRHLAVGDRVAIHDPDWPRTLVVAAIPDRPVAKALVPTLYLDESPPRPAPDPMARLLRRPPALRERGAGRPTKKDRREIDRWEGDEG